MKKPNRISFSLFDEEVKNLINASAKIFPINQEDVDSNYNPNNYEYGRVNNHIYRWNEGEWSYIIADDIDIDWGDIKNKPASYPPSTHTHSELHTHTNKSILDLITQTLINTWNTVTAKADKIYVDTELGKKSDNTHNHDTKYSQLGHTHDYANSIHNHDTDYYKKSEVDTKLGSKSDNTHNHDGAYYKKSEVDTRLGGKANTSHKHSESDIDDLDKYTTSEVDNLLSNKSDVGHKHSEVDITDLDKYTKAEVDTKLAGKSSTNHTHSDLHTHGNKTLLDKLIETEPNTSYDLSNLDYIEDIRNGYTEGHSHDNFNVLQGITEILVDGWNSAVSHITDAFKHITPSERSLWNTVSDKANQSDVDTALEGKSNINHTHDYSPTTHNHDTVYSKLGHTHNYADSEHTHTKLDITDFSHNHDERYYTESEIDTKLSSKADSTTLSGHISNSTAHVTQTDKTNWNNKQDALGYTPVNKAGDTLNGSYTGNGKLFLKNSFYGMGGQALSDFSMSGIYNRQELINVAHKGGVEVNIEGAGSVSRTKENLNLMFNGEPDFLNISGVNETTTKIEIIADLGSRAEVYSDATWQPFVQLRIAPGGSHNWFNKIKVEVSDDKVNWSYPDDETAWGTDDFLNNQAIPSLWMGKNATPKPSYLWRYIRFIFTDIRGNSGNFWISQLGMRHRNAPYTRKYVTATGDKMYGALDMTNNKITNVATPTNNKDVATKEYVDNNAGGVHIGTTKPTDGSMWYKVIG